MFDKIKIIDNFLIEQDFLELTSIKLDKVNNKEKKFTIIKYLRMAL